MPAVTRLGLHGGPRSPYGSFAGKTEQVSYDVRQRANLPRWSLPTPTRQYNQAAMAQTLALIAAAEARNHKVDRDLEVGRSNVIVMTDADGVRWKVEIDTSGNLTTTSLG